MSTKKIAFYSLLLTVFLLVVFFVPGGSLPLVLGKTLIVLLGLIFAGGAFLVGTQKSGEVVLPWHPFFLVAILLPVIYFFSGLQKNGVGFFGYSLEVGTFASVLLGVLLLLIIPLVVREKASLLKLLSGAAVAATGIALFGLLKLIHGGRLLNFGIFSGPMGSPVGSWTDYGVVIGLLVLISLLSLEILELKKLWRIVIYIVFVSSLFLLAIINFSIVWVLLLISAVLLLIYFGTIERKVYAGTKKFRLPSILLLLVSILFVINPVISSSKITLRDYLSNRFAVQNLDVRPSLSATFSVSQSVLRAHPLLGSGPNTFGDDWFLYKPKDINSTLFWNTNFLFGVGFLPTQLASVGGVGSLAWLVFFVLFLLLGLRTFLAPHERRERFLLISSFLSSLFLWASLAVYVPGPSSFYLAFFFSGLFLAALIQADVLPVRVLHFREKPVSNFLSVLIVGLLALGLITLGYLAIRKVISVVYFEKAFTAANVADTSATQIEINKALDLSKVDIYYHTLSQLDLSQAQAALSSTTGSAEENKLAFQNALSESISNAQTAVNLHPQGYTNWIALGSIYASLVPAPLSVSGAYDNAAAAYLEAGKINPLTPEVPLLLARLEYDHGNVAAARTHLNEALALKSDYADAYFMLTQIEVSQNDVPKAIASGETAALLSPNNAGIFFELGLLKYSSLDYVGAADALSKAVTLVPGYANAKYFLGLSLDKLGKVEEALIQFSDLLKSNPNNLDLETIIGNIQNGKDALYQAPSGLHPEKKPAPPISSRTQ